MIKCIYKCGAPVLAEGPITGVRRVWRDTSKIAS